MLQDPGNGMLEAWVIMAIEIVLVLCAALYYEAVFGASEDSDGRRLHPFFLLGCKLGPDDPRGWAWFLPRKLAAIHWRLTHTHQLPQGGPPAAAVKPAATTSAAGSMAEASSTGATVRDHTPPNVPPSPAPSFASAVSRTVSDMEAGRRAAAAASAGDECPADVAAERARVDLMWAFLHPDPNGDPPGLTPPAGMTGTSPSPPAVLLRGLRKVYASKVDPVVEHLSIYVFTCRICLYVRKFDEKPLPSPLAGPSTLIPILCPPHFPLCTGIPV